MNNYSTNKRHFEEQLIKSNKQPEYVYQNQDLELIQSYEDADFFGYEVTPKTQGTICRECGQWITKIKDTRISYPTIGLINDKPVLLKLRRKLYTCHDCQCSTIHRIDGLFSHAQKFQTVKKQIINEIVTKKQTYSQVARRYKMSVSTIIHCFDRAANPNPDLSTVTHISIDETRLIPKVGNYQFVVTNALNGAVLAILPTRLAHSVATFLHTKFPKVEVITQDFWDTYRRAALDLASSPLVVVDRFHFVRFVMWAYNRTRVEIQKQTKIRLMKTWKLQNKSRSKLSVVSKKYVDQIINQDKNLKHAYEAKEFFLHLSRTRDLDYFREGIKKWRAFVLRHQLHHFYSILTTLDNWEKEIENMVVSPFSNGGAERANRTMKQAKNQAFGYQNLTRTEKLMIMRTSPAH